MKRRVDEGEGQAVDDHNPFSAFACDEAPVRGGAHGGDGSSVPVALGGGLRTAKRRGNASRYFGPVPRPDVPEWFGLNDELLADIMTMVFVHERNSKLGKKHPTRALHAVFRYAPLSQTTRRACMEGLSRVLALSTDQSSAFVAAMCGKNVFLTGGAGVGKSHTLRVIIGHLPRDGTAVTASTGCAAAIIGATTLHAFAALGLGELNADVYIKRIRESHSWARDRIRATQRLVIDEVGMLDGALFGKAARVVGEVRRNYTNDLCANAVATLPFGDVQLICCGDFCQLPPVQVEKGGWVFESRAWKNLDFEVCELNTVHRQQADVTFAEVLSHVRLGVATEDDFKYLKSNSAPEALDGALRLYTRNEPADEDNEFQLRKLIREGARPHTFTALDSGTSPHLLERCPAPAKLHVCIGARVMCLRNINEHLVNGSMGTVTDVVVEYPNIQQQQQQQQENDQLHVYLPPIYAYATLNVRVDVLFDGIIGGAPFEYSFNSYCSEMDDEDQEAFRHYKFTVSEIRGGQGSSRSRIQCAETTNNVVAQRIQLPLRLAWAVSVHKSQGMSLERATIDFSGIFAPGQAYTALSRMRTLAGVKIIGLMLKHLNFACAKALQWYDKNNSKSGAGRK